MDDKQDNPVKPAASNAGGISNGANANTEPTPVKPGTPVDNLVQDISKPEASAKPATEASVAQGTPTQATTAPIQSVASTPAPAPVSAPVQAAAQNTQPYGAPKKSHTGLIVGIVILLVLVVGGIGGFLFYRQHEKNERVLADGLVQFVTAKELTANTVFTVDFDSEEVDYVKINMQSSRNAKLESSADAKVELKLKKYDAINAEAEVMEGENALYFRIVDSGNVSTVISKAFESEMGDDSGVDVKAILESVFTSVGNSWYEVPYSKIDETGELKKSLDCVREKMSSVTEGENWNKVLDIYQKNPFISVAAGAKIEKVNGYKKYPLTIDEDKAEDFMDKLSDEDFVKEINACTEEETTSSKNYLYDYNDYDSNDNDHDWSYNDSYYNEGVSLDSEKEDKGKYNIVLGIKPWSHELVWAGFDYEKKAESDYDTGIKVSGEINLSYTSNITTPGDTKSIDTLLETVQKTINDSSKEAYYKSYCTEDNSYSGFDSEENCKAAVDKAFGDTAESADLNDLLDSLMYL